jgi:hypothetical protein
MYKYLIIALLVSCNAYADDYQVSEQYTKLLQAMIWAMQCMDHRWEYKYSEPDKVFEKRDDICSCYGLGSTVIKLEYEPLPIPGTSFHHHSKRTLEAFMALEKRCIAEYVPEDER